MEVSGPASRSVRFTSRERSLSIHWIGGWMGPRAVLDAVVKRIIPSPRRESNPRTPIVQPVAQRYTNWAVTALCKYYFKCNYMKELTPWCRIFFEKSLVTRQIIPCFLYRTRGFITVYWTLSRASRIHFAPSITIMFAALKNGEHKHYTFLHLQLFHFYRLLNGVNTVTLWTWLFHWENVLNKYAICDSIFAVRCKGRWTEAADVRFWPAIDCNTPWG
jgi:hypothetical protein